VLNLLRPPEPAGVRISGELRSQAFAITYEHPIYDCLYLALAIQTGAVVVTADKRFLNAFAKTEHADRVIALAAAAQQI
jgi:predicted nucleic acid-binding protein